MSRNLGHRCGSVDETAEENTLERFRDNVRFESLESWSYTEFDIVESKDGQLFVFHDRDFRKYGWTARVQDTYAAVIAERYPHIPSYNELVEELLKHDLKKPIRVEIKNLVSEAGILKLVKHTARLRDKFADVQFIAFRAHFKRSFPKKTRDNFKQLFTSWNFKVLNVKNHKEDLFNPGKLGGFLNWF